MIANFAKLFALQEKIPKLKLRTKSHKNLDGRIFGYKIQTKIQFSMHNILNGLIQ